MGGALAAIALVAGGIAVGAVLDDDEPLEVVTPAVESVSSPEPGDTRLSDPAEPTPGVAAPTPTPSPEAPAPTAPPAGFDPEPASTVASAVAPAVVQILVPNFGQGSGIIYSAEGYILTNAHVVGGSTEVSVTLANGSTVDGEVLGADTGTDVAVVQIDASLDFTVAELGGIETIEVGQLAVAIGSPFGLEGTVTAGIVSAVNRIVPNDLSGDLTRVAMIQTDAPINPGNSGGALADIEGRVVGMNTSIRTDGGQGNLGVGFAIPADTAKLIADRIVEGVPLESGYLGVSLTDATVGAPGAVITDVVDGDPAATAGLLAGDKIVGVDGTAIRSSGELAAWVRLQLPGQSVQVEVERDGQTETFTVELGTL